MIYLSPIDSLSPCFLEGYTKLLDALTPASLGSTSLSARVEFLPEEHKEGGYTRTRNIEYLFANYSYKRKDIILVEDDEKKGRSQLNLKSIGHFQRENCIVRGWDNHESCIEYKNIYQKLKEIEEGVERLEKRPLPHNWEKDLNLLFQTAKNGELEAWQNYNNSTLSDCFTNPKRNEEKITLLESMKRYVSNTEAYFILKDFPKRQSNLENSLDACLNETKGTEAVIYVMLGLLHVDLKDKQVGKHALSLINSLQKKNIPYRIF